MRSGILTEYKGIVFRSRLEATWARFFDAIKWPWLYEPYDLAGYIPDFVLPFKMEVIVEVKPCAKLDDLREHVSKIEKSGWSGDAFIVGVGPLLHNTFYWFGLCGQHHETCWLWDPSLFFYCPCCKSPSPVLPMFGTTAFGCPKCADTYRAIGCEFYPTDAIRTVWNKCQNRTAWSPESSAAAKRAMR